MGLWMIGVSQIVGCVAKSPEPQLGSDLPASRIAAIYAAAEHTDHAQLPMLIEELSSDDPAVRLYAIAALEKLTGQRLGFEPAANMAEREKAIDRWVAWYKAQRQEESI